jgi:hypothetical protein
MMKRAMGGFLGFAAMSPTVILKAAAANHAPLQEFASGFDLAGEVIPDRAGLAAVSGGNARRARSHRGGTKGMIELPKSAIGLLPPTVVMSSCADHMVPWHEAAEYVDSLHRVGAPARHLIYNHVGHSDYVMSWRPAGRGRLGNLSPPPPPPPLKEFARDLLKLLRREVPLVAPRHAARSKTVVAEAKVARSMHRLEGLAHLSRL